MCSEAGPHGIKVYLLASRDYTHDQIAVYVKHHDLGHLIARKVLPFGDLLGRIRERMVIDLIGNLGFVKQLPEFFHYRHMNLHFIYLVAPFFLDFSLWQESCPTLCLRWPLKFDAFCASLR